VVGDAIGLVGRVLVVDVTVGDGVVGDAVGPSLSVPVSGQKLSGSWWGSPTAVTSLAAATAMGWWVTRSVGALSVPGSGESGG
jgi:hypothetical protein